MPDVKLLPEIPAFSSDVTIGVGDGFWPPVEEISSADQVTVIGDGTTRRPLHAGASASGIDVQDEGVAIAGNPHSTVNFVGAGVTATDVGGVATITIPGAAGGQAFEVAVGAATDPNGFDVALPVAMADGTWIPEVALQPPTVDDVVAVFVLSRSATTLRLGASSNFANGTTLLITISARTN